MKYVSVKLKYFVLYSCLLLTIIPLSSLPVKSEDTIETEGNYKYIVVDNTVTILHYNGTETSIIIPSQLRGLSVTKIGDFAFCDNTTATSIVIPEGITTIGQDAFFFNRTLTDINIPSSVVSIGDRAFAHCGLKNIILPESITQIGYRVFAGCTELETITIPASVTDIDTFAFNHGAWEDPPQYPIPGLSIIGYENTYTQSYAKANGIPFIAIKNYPAVTLGDVNADEAIDAQDALLALQQSVKTVALGEASAAMADVDKNGAINARDALLMLQYSVHLINSFD